MSLYIDLPQDCLCGKTVQQQRGPLIGVSLKLDDVKLRAVTEVHLDGPYEFLLKRFRAPRASSVLAVSQL